MRPSTLLALGASLIPSLVAADCLQFNGSVTGSCDAGWVIDADVWYSGAHVCSGTATADSGTLIANCESGDYFAIYVSEGDGATWGEYEDEEVDLTFALSMNPSSVASSCDVWEFTFSDALFGCA